MKDELSKALNSGRCIVCFLMGQDESDLIAGWVGRGEEEVEKQFRVQKRLCNYHFWKLEKFATGVTMASVTKFMLEKIISTFKEKDAYETIFMNDDEGYRNNLSDKNACPKHSSQSDARISCGIPLSPG